jgi:hypothetical protein
MSKYSLVKQQPICLNEENAGKPKNPIKDFQPFLFFVRGAAGFRLIGEERCKSRVARGFLFRPKLPIWVYFGGPWNGKCCYIFWSFGIY